MNLVNKTLIWLETDLEPDDLLAIYLLVKRGYYPSYIVVGESQASLKAQRMVRYLRLLKLEQLLPQDLEVKIIQGRDSHRIYKNEGAEFETLTLNTIKSGALDYKTHYIALFKEYVKETLAGNSVPRFVSLKPAHELGQFQSELASELAQTQGYFYGGFNFRCLFWDPKLGPQGLISILNRFKSVDLYESYQATGQENSMTPQNFPQTWTDLNQKSSAYIKYMILAVTLWNSHLLQISTETCAKLLLKYQCPEEEWKLPPGPDRDTYNRNYKIQVQIRAHPHDQMVLADCALAGILEDSKYDSYLNPVEINFNSSGYTQLTSSLSSSIRIYQGISISDLDLTLFNLIK